MSEEEKNLNKEREDHKDSDSEEGPNMKLIISAGANESNRYRIRHRAPAPHPEPTIWMTKEKRFAIYKFLFTEGMMTAKKGAHMPKHRSWHTVCPTFMSRRPRGLSGLLPM